MREKRQMKDLLKISDEFIIGRRDIRRELTEGGYMIKKETITYMREVMQNT